MNSITRMVAMGAACGIAALVQGPVVALAAEGRAEIGERFERMERRLDQIAAQQEQMGHQMRGQAERQEQRFKQMAERREQFMRQMSARGRGPGPQMQRPPESVRPPVLSPEQMRAPLPPREAPLLAKPLKGLHDALGLFVLVWIVCNILMAILIFSDIRKRGEGSALFGAMALIAGIPAAVIYSLVRMGDRMAAAGSTAEKTGGAGAAGGGATPSTG